MGSFLRGKKKKTSLDHYEAYSVLSQGCRQLSQTCVTRGARRILQRLADQFDREAREVEGFGELATCPARVAPLRRTLPRR
jgi:hypothetical protein